MTTTPAPTSSFEDRLRRVRRVPGTPLGGVCAGVAAAFGLDVVLVRVLWVIAATAGGVGILAYLACWVLVPRAEPGATPAPPSGVVRPASWQVAAGTALIALAGLGLLRELGIWWSDQLVWPGVLVAAGVGLIWRQSTLRAADAPSREPGTVPGPRDLPGLGELPPLGPRLALGALLVVGGALLVLDSIGGFGSIAELALSLGVVALGVTVVFGTSWLGLVAALREERAARIRTQERAEMAAHLHDSVLQTLALIQRRADGDVAALARRQERELRAWLAGTDARERPATLAAALEAMAAAVEDDHGVAVEVVVVGDAPLDPTLEAVVAAAREATVNAAKFAGTGRVDVFAEVAPDRVEVFVRDRGAGFDPEAVDPGRRGIAESVVGRMRRHGGEATIRSAAGEGTEVELAVRR